MATQQQELAYLSSDMSDTERQEQARPDSHQALAQVRQYRVERALESNASIKRKYRALVGRGASPAQIAKGLRDTLRMQAATGRVPARDAEVLAERARAEANFARAEADNRQKRLDDVLQRLQLLGTQQGSFQLASNADTANHTDPATNRNVESDDQAKQGDV